MRKTDSEAMTKFDSLSDAFEEKRRKARRKYQDDLYEIDSNEKQLAGWVETVKTQGIVLMDHGKAQEIVRDLGVDMYKVLAAQCKRWGRPYIKCAEISYSDIAMQVNKGGAEEALISTLMFVSAPLKAKQGWSKRKGTIIVQEPDVFSRYGYEYPSGDVNHWNTPRTISMLFTGTRGKQAFMDWKEFCQTDRVQRIYLGI